jgi:hypothetical protein
VVVVAIAVTIPIVFSHGGSGDCGGHQLHGECSGPYTAAERAAIQVEEMAVPPFNSYRLTEVTCRLSGERATCDGTRNDGRRVRVRFTVGRHGHLSPLCVSPPQGIQQPNIFCAS